MFKYSIKITLHKDSDIDDNELQKGVCWFPLIVTDASQLTNVKLSFFQTSDATLASCIPLRHHTHHSGITHISPHHPTSVHISPYHPTSPASAASPHIPISSNITPHHPSSAASPARAAAGSPNGHSPVLNLSKSADGTNSDGQASNRDEDDDEDDERLSEPNDHDDKEPDGELRETDPPRSGAAVRGKCLLVVHSLVDMSNVLSYVLAVFLLCMCLALRFLHGVSSLGSFSGVQFYLVVVLRLS